MRTLKTTAAAAGIAAMMLLGACAHRNATAENSDYTHVDQAATTGSSEGTSTTPAVIPGPAKVDSSGNVYTSSASPGSGNASATGMNTNVNIVPEKPKAETSVTYSNQPAPTPVVEETKVTETTVTETPVVETPMTSATTEQTTTTTTTHQRLSKD